MDLLDATITAPTISSSLHGGPGLIKWLGANYALALAVLLVTGGQLGDKYSRRRTFLIGIAGFTAASLACGLAWDPPSIIVARLVQGAFGALLGRTAQNNRFGAPGLRARSLRLPPSLSVMLVVIATRRRLADISERSATMPVHSREPSGEPSSSSTPGHLGTIRGFVS